MMFFPPFLQNQSQRGDHLYSEFPVKNYKPTRSASPSENLFITGQQPQTEQTGSEV